MLKKAQSEIYTWPYFYNRFNNGVDIAHRTRSVSWELENTVKKFENHFEPGKNPHRGIPAFFRPAELDILLGDYSQAKEKFGWQPKTHCKELVRIMVKADRERMSNLKQ
jgi:GDPmannose 4,6-dehydratase